jgi:hypothetical protein
VNIGDPNSVVKNTIVDEPLAEAVLGLAYIFPVDQVPAYFQFAWNRYPDGFRQMPAQIRARDTVQQFELSHYMPTMDWSRGDLNFPFPAVPPVPVEEVNLLGRAELDKDDAVRVVGQLLKNIYSALEYRDESAIYDKLAVSVNGRQIESIYLEQRKRMEALSRGGPRVKIHEVSMGGIEHLVRRGNTFEMIGTWDVSGTVTHFGHTHERRNRYGAKLTLAASNTQWKIIDIVVREEQRML